MKNLSKKSYMIYGMGVSYFMLDQIFVQWLKYFYLPPENVMLEPVLSARYIIYGFIIMRLIDAIADPVVGYISDNTTSKYGRRSFYMLIGGIPLALAMILFFFPQGTTQFGKFVYFSIIGGIYFIAYTLVGGPYNSLIPDLANSKEERINLSTVQSVFRLIFTAIPLVLSGLIIDKLTKFNNGNITLGFRYFIIIFSILAIIGVYLCAIFLNENKLTSHKAKSKKASIKETIKQLYNREVLLYFIGIFLFFSSFNIIRGSLTYYVSLILNESTDYVSKLSAVLFLTSAIFFPITSKLAKKYGFNKIMVLDIVIIIVGTLGMVLFKTASIGLIFIFCGIIGVGISGAAFIFPPAMLSEIAVGINDRTGISVEGLLFGIQGFFLKLAFMADAIISVSALVYGSSINSNGLRSATKEGVILSLIISVGMLMLAAVIFISKKKEN